MSTNKQELVKDGQLHNPAKVVTPPMFVCLTPPEVYEDSMILAVVAPTLSRIEKFDEEWFHADFYAFNYLFKGLGSRQRWLTALPPQELLNSPKKGCQLLHGNPYQDRKYDRMIEAFLEEAKEWSEEAKKKDRPLILMVFCHGSETHELMLNGMNVNRGGGLTIQRLKGVLEPGARVTLVATACYSGGWAMSPDLNWTMMDAAGDESLSTGWPASESIGRTCGSIFASSLIDTLTNTASPLLADNDKEPPAELQPENPNDRQTQTYNSFCWSILDTLQNRMTRLWHHRDFSFKAQDDQWAHSWTGRMGYPLEKFEERWNRLPTVPYTGSAERKAHLDQDPGNPTFGGSTKPALTGGFDSTNEEIVISLDSNHVKEAARLFLGVCPGYWDAAPNIGLRGILRRCVEGTRPNRVPGNELDIMAAIRFRWEMALWADLLVRELGLPVPNGQECLTWNEGDWKLKNMQHEFQDFDNRYKLAKRELRGYTIYTRPEQGDLGFARPRFYIAAAVTEANKSKEATLEVIREIHVRNQRNKEFQEKQGINMLMKENCIRYRSREWLNSIGRNCHET
ncbi:hypothetical protein F4677DRAFT_464445 [Hypoxylon crocopeplum]|nr:hypothetical protein F4677DRAFT_464445 [Hypoxylon crocopeplum]